MPITPNEAIRIKEACTLLRAAEKPVRILRTISWKPEVKAEFFRNKADALPEITYPEFDPQPTEEKLETVIRTLDRNTRIGRWLKEIARNIATGARMLASAGTPEFLEHSTELYGAPSKPLLDGLSTPLGLAEHLHQTFDYLCHVDVGAPSDARFVADDVAERIRQAVNRFFGESAPTVEIVETLSANALAGPNRIRLRRNARFTDRDAMQLINHEAYIHVATALNGRTQDKLPILAAGHPGTTRTQEGLAVFAEFITGSMELDRLRRLADRVRAIQMAIDGADFLDVYRYFLDRTDNEDQSFENARRVFRGGVVSGGVPFTKDVVYLDGLLRVHNFLRTAVAAGRADCLRLLFCGKLDIEYIPALCELTHAGLCRPPKYLPPWARDLRFLLSYLTYSAFLSSVDLQQIHAHYEQLFQDAVPVLAALQNGSAS